MRLRIGIFIALFAAVLLIWMIARDDAPPRPRAESAQPQSTGETKETSETETETGQDHEPDIEATPVADEAKDTQQLAHVTGIVVEPNGRAVAEAIVTARVEDDDEIRLETRSGSDGRFAFDIATRRSMIRLDAIKGEAYGAEIVGMRGGRPNETRIVLKPAAQLLVNVTSRRDKAPLAGARVQWGTEPRGNDDDSISWAEHRFGPVETDARGQARLWINRPALYELEAEHDEVGVVVRKLELEVKPQTIDLEIAGGSAILGRVTDDLRAPIAGATIVLSPQKQRQQFGYRRAKSDADGRFTIHGVEAGKFTIQARAEKYLETRQELEKKDDTNDVEYELVLKRGSTIEGRVIDRTGAAVAGWRVIAGNASQGNTKEATSTRDGSFVIEGCGEGLYTLVATRPGEDRSPFQLLFESSGGRVRAKAGDRDVILYATAPATLAGHVEIQGEPPASYVVRVANIEKEHPGSARDFRITNLSSGKRAVVVSATGFASDTRELELVEGATTSVSFVLAKGRSLSGRVIDHGTEQPIAGANVLTVGAEPIRTANDGSFTLEGLPLGKVTVVVSANAYARRLVRNVEVSDATPPITIRLNRGVGISGRLLMGDAPVWALVTARAGKEDYSMARDDSVGENGEFELQGVMPGRQQLDVHWVIGRTSRSKQLFVDVPEAGLHGVEIDLRGSGTRLIVGLAGNVTQTHRVVLMAGRQTQANFEAEQQSVSFRVGQQQIELSGLEPGEYTLASYANDPFGGDDEAPPFQPIYVTIRPGDREVRATLPVR